MPGLVGLVTGLPRDRALRELRQMVASMCHEASYVTEVSIHERLGVYVASVALPGPSSASSVTTDDRSDVTVLFSGEDFPSTGSTTSTSGCMASRYTAAKATFLASLNGRFHGLVVDGRSSTSTLFVDRYGLQRIYYHGTPDTFYFAAEAKAILAVRPELRQLDQRSLAERLVCGCVLESRTLFAGIHVLPGAAAWSFSPGNPVPMPASYFSSSEWEQQCPLTAEAYYRELRDVFAERVGHYFSGPERIGMSLTGGLDSRMIQAWHRATPGTVPCYTFGGPFRDSHDVRLATRLSAVWNQPHHVLRLGQDFLSDFGRLAERSVYLTDGCVDVSRAADLYLNEHARRIAPVRITGNYGGEVLRGIRAFKPGLPPADLLAPELAAHVPQAVETYEHVANAGPAVFATFRQAPWHHFGLLALEQTQVTVRAPFLDNEVVRTVFRAPTLSASNDEMCLRLIEEGNPEFAAIPTDRGLGGDRAGPRSFLWQRMLHLQFRAEYAYDYGMPQWLVPIDRLLAPIKPERLFLGRHKFSHFRIWYRDALSRYVKEVLLDSSSLSKAHINPAEVRKLVTGHVEGRLNATSAIHQLLTLEHIMRLFIDRPPTLHATTADEQCARSGHL